MNIELLLDKALRREWLTVDEGLFLYENAKTAELMHVGNELRKQHNNPEKVTWIIDRNVNTTNVCIVACKFCNFYRPLKHKEAYITTTEQYIQKIDELMAKGGNQLLLQGGLHPKLGLSYYTDLFSELKRLYPNIRLHALSPSEIMHVVRMEKKTIAEVLSAMKEAGLDSVPGAGAEILVDRVRDVISKIKCTTQEWLDVMHEAHKLNIITSSTMMFGHVETPRERIEHLEVLRATQARKPEGSRGFVSFTPWPFQDGDTVLSVKHGVKNSVTSEEYIRLIAIARIMLENITHIQASWLTVGTETAKICLYAGANDLGSIMIEENVVSAAGADYRLDADQMRELITEAGFQPQLRDQEYKYINN